VNNLFRQVYSFIPHNLAVAILIMFKPLYHSSGSLSSIFGGPASTVVFMW